MNDQISLDDPDAAIADEVHAGFSGARYDRPVSSLRHPSRVPRAAGLVAAAAVVALATTAAVVARDGATSPALAWSPTPAAASAADEAAARKACSSLDPSTGPDSGFVSVMVGAEASASDGGTVTATNGSPPPGGAPDTIVTDSGGGASLAPVPEAPLPPGELPPLQSLDLRGTGGLATFADDAWVASCLLIRTDEGFERGVLTYQPASQVVPSTEAGIAMVMVSSMAWTDGRHISTVWGEAPGAASVVLELAGQEPATAEVVDGRFSMWWPGDLGSGGSGTLRALAADGTELGSIGPLVPDLPSGPDGAVHSEQAPVSTGGS